MFGKKIKEARKSEGILSPIIARDLNIHQTSISYFERRNPMPIDLYLNFLRKHNVDLNKAFLIESTHVSKILKIERQNAKITWQEMCEFSNIKQASLSYIENRPDTNFILYLKYLVQRGVDINKIYE